MAGQKDLTTKEFTLIATGNALQDQNLAKLTSINGKKINENIL